MTQLDTRINSAWWALHVGLGAVAFVAGLDKFFNVLADWPAYLSPLAASVLPITPPAFMGGVGVVEMIVGVTILSPFTRLGSYVASVWLLGIAANLVTTGHFFDVAARDVVMAIAAYTSARLTEVREDALAGEAHAAGEARPQLARAAH
jgi:uncharacterized membrane protein YphA (DoxX/SURF4 family)